MLIKKVSNSDNFKYNDLAIKYGTIFNTYDWLRIFKDEVQIYGIYNKGNNLIGGFSIYKEKKFNFKIYRNSPFTPYVGPFLEIEAKNSIAIMNVWKKVLSLMAEFIEELPCSVVSVSLDKNIVDTQPFIWRKFTEKIGLDFKNLSRLEKFGITMHYLRNSEDTLKFLNETGYLFDSTLYKLKNPFEIGNLWEFPLHIMDGYLFYKNRRWQNQTLEQAKYKTKRIIEEAYKKGIKYFTILFHDRYFSNSFKSWKNRYVWAIDYLKNNKFEFINYPQAIKEMEELEH